MNILNTFTNLINNSFLSDYIPKANIKDIFEIAILSLLIYYGIKMLRGTRIWIIVKGIIIAIALYGAAYFMQLNVIVEIFSTISIFLAAAVIVAVQPEIRKFLETIGNSSINNSIYKQIKEIFNKKENTNKLISDNSIQELVKGCFNMGEVKTGALIVIEKDIPLSEYVESGINIGAEITSALLINIFEKNTPLHDGAVIIQRDRISAATCYLPLSSNNNIDKSLGTRHRAAIGLSEVCDAIVIVVSEETGAVSVAVNGVIKHNLTRDRLFDELHTFQTSSKVESIKKQTKNIKMSLPLMSLSFIIGLFIWIITVNSLNPVTSITFKNVPIKIINEDTMAEYGKSFKIESDPYVNVKVTNRKDILDDIKMSDIEVVADLSKISFTNTVQLEVNTINSFDSEYSLSKDNIQVILEDLISKEMEIEVEYSEKFNDNYLISSINLDNNSITVIGPESFINTLDKAVINIDESDITNSSNKLTKSVKLFDKNGSDITEFDANVKEINVELYVYNTKEIQLKINLNIADEILNNLVERVEGLENTIIVAGENEELNGLESLTINVDISTGFNDIYSNSLIKAITVQNYLPEGLNVTKEYSTINIILYLKDYYWNEINFSSSDIEIINNINNVSLTDNNYIVRLISTDYDITSITISNMQPYIDAKNIQDDKKVKLQFRNFDKYVIGEIYVNTY